MPVIQRDRPESFLSLFRIQMVFMINRNFILLLVLLPFLLVSCGGEDGWSKALEETAPPNPREALAKRPAHTESESAASPDIKEAEEIESDDVGTSNEQGLAGGQLQSDPGKATLNVILLKYPNCYKGAVKLFVDGTMIGIFGQEGKLSVSVEPGQRHLDIWDNGGRWTIEVTAPAGASLDIEIACDDRRSYEEA